MSVRLDDVPSLRCADCGGALSWTGSLIGEVLGDGRLDCHDCGADWPVRNGLVRLYRESRFTGSDRFMRRIYQSIPRLHDPAVKLLIPLLQLGGTEKALRDGYIEKLELDAFEPGSAPRILEVGVGTGANLPLIRAALPAGVQAEIWGLDPSAGMMSEAVRTGRADRVRMLLGDAHHLPFPDNSFDRVFHVGGINGFRDPGRALREMARVAKPGTPIVAVDEQRDPKAARTLYHKLGFAMVTFYDGNPRAPVEQVPLGAKDLETVQVSSFFYCMRFRM